MNLREAVNYTMTFAIKELGLENFPGHIQIKFVDMQETKAYGEVTRHENIFLISLQKGREIGATMMTLLHEMVHVKQFAYDNLAEVFDETIPYYERWWEIEAFAKSKAMAAEMMK